MKEITVYKDKFEVIEFEKWNKKILNVYWIIAIISTITEIIIYFLTKDQILSNKFDYILAYIITPSVNNVILLSISEIINKLIKNKHKEAAKYLIIISGTFMAFNLICIHYSVSMMYLLFILPIILSVYYGSHKIAAFAFFFEYDFVHTIYNILFTKYPFR